MIYTQDIIQPLKDEAARMDREQARYLVDAYYQVQDYRKAANNQWNADDYEDDAPLPIVAWLAGRMEAIENDLKKLLESYAQANPVGRWAMSIMGIGPVISAGLLAHIDITQAPTVGHIWSYAGLDPTAKWGRGEKRPHNARLKTLCWKIGESFVKVCNRDGDIYGQVIQERKAYEQEKNEAGEYAEQAAAMLERTPNHKQKDIYAEGKLPDGHIHMRAKRYAVKLFLAHWHHAAYIDYYGGPPAKPYILSHGDHAHFIEPPNLAVLKQ